MSYRERESCGQVMVMMACWNDTRAHDTL